MSGMEMLFAGAFGPVLIFCLRIVDVSLSTVRILLAVRGQRLLVPLIGMFEVMVWLFAAGNAMQHLDSPLHLIGYATGFGTGSLVGLWIEEKLAIGFATVRVITTQIGLEMAEGLRTQGYGVTEFAAKGRTGPVEVIYLVVPRREIERVLREVDRWDPTAFVTVEQPRDIRWGWMHSTPRRRLAASMQFSPFRRGGER